MPWSMLIAKFEQVEPILKNKEELFDFIDTRVFPHLEDVIDRYIYGKFLELRAKYYYAYFDQLKKAGFSDDQALKFVLIEAEKTGPIASAIQACASASSGFASSALSRCPTAL